MKQDIETKNPSDLSGKRLKAYRKLMQKTSASSKSLMTVHSELSDIYKTKKSLKECLKIFDNSPEIPLEVRDQRVVNTA